MVWVWLLHLAWAARSNTFRLPNERLKVRGVSRYVKRRAPQDLEAARLIRIFKESGKSPTVTLFYS